MLGARQWQQFQHFPECRLVLRARQPMHLSVQISCCQHVEEVSVLQPDAKQGQMHGCE